MRVSHYFKSYPFRPAVWAFCLLWSNILLAQPAVRASLDSTNMLIGDHMKLQLQASLKEGQEFAKADLSVLDSTEMIEVLEVSEIDTIQTKPNYILQQDITFTVFDSGTFFIPAIPVQFVKDGNLLTLNTNRLVINVTTVPTDSLALAPIKGIITEPLAFEDILPYLIGVAALLLVAFLIYYFIRRQKQKKVPPPPPVIIPAHEIALDKLDVLDKEKLWQRGEVKAYQSQLTYIVREYLENRYGIQALEFTTDQIITQLKSADISDDYNNKLRDLLQMADLVKFAKAIPPADIHEREMAEVRQFVLDTKMVRTLIDEPDLTDKNSNV